MANERMLIGAEIIKYKNKLSTQKEKISNYLQSIDREDDVNFYDHLYLINDSYSHAISYLRNLDEEIFLRSPFYDDLSTISHIVNKLEELTKKFFSQEKIKNFPKVEVGQESPILIAIESYISNLVNNLASLKNESTIVDRLDIFSEENEKLNEKVQIIENSLDDLKNIELHKIFENDSEIFKKIALKYEIAFYITLVFLFIYFFGWYVDIDISGFKFKFAEQFHGNHTPTFYVQKISLIILSTTLAAFLLKRSFMNRRLADDAYRTAKELDALPRYMAGMSNEMKEKIRFDLAYKYFGNGIHHDSYTSGENLMHENIKANTDFIKAVKDLPPKNDEKRE
ncbi:hypothetical protein MJ046_06745 [Acinetobacter bereziniae]|uniref:hypothetical protein n=1 Tax=Acinetobacter bereziniae TaxID=106648 RepID=UPI0022EA9D84|nr:hypothetical protein [Acinetobacter bereziniae]MDA3440037.1 hypothetical protein [Acinetobacter bereziniae]